MMISGTAVFSPAAAIAGDKAKLRERADLEKRHTWATEDIFAAKSDWERALATVKQSIAKLESYKGSLGKGAAHLHQVLQDRDQTEAELDRVYVYASLIADQDTRVSENEGLRSRGRSLYVEYSQATSWLDPELTAIPFATLDSWMRENEDLALYRQAFDDLFRQKKHILTPREEELLAMTGEVRATPGNAYNLLTNADMQYPAIMDESGVMREMDDSAFYLFMRSTDRRVRKDAYDAIVGTYAQYKNTASALLNGVVQNHILTVKSRNYDSCLAAALDGSNIPVKVYDTLIETVNDNLSLLHRYQEIRKRTLKLDGGVHAYDLFAPFITGRTMNFDYDEGVKLILTALEPLGDDYLKKMKRGFESRWVDVYPTKGKRSGAYSSGTFLTQPYILMNYQGSFDSVSTLAHEMGHSMHSTYSRGTQPYVYSDYTIFCAEVASTCNEILLQHHILKQTFDPKDKLFLLTEFLEGFRGTVFRQTMFSEFEQQIHEMAESGKPLTADALGEAYRTIMIKYYGPAYVHDDLVDNYWIRIPHFYYNFYVYKYATSYCAASNIANRIMSGEDGALDAYLSFLKAGSSRYSVDLLKMARVDMTTSQPVEDAMQIFAGMLDQIEALLAELDM